MSETFYKARPSGPGFRIYCLFALSMLGITMALWRKGAEPSSLAAMKTGPTIAGPRSTDGPLDANDLLVLRFDNSLNGENGETPTTATGTSFQPGVSNQGVLLPAPNQLFYQSANNINATEGTFECWVKPAWNGNDNLDHYLLRYGSGNGEMVIGKDAANNLKVLLLRFAGIPDIGAAFNISAWQANQWHYLAFTWSNSNKRLQVYIDGVLKDERAFTMNLQLLDSTNFQIGGNGAGGYANTVVDNLRISNIARSAQEVSDRMLEGLTISSWSLNPATPSIEMYPGWFYWVPLGISAATNIGNLSLPVLAASWSSSNPSVAVMDSSGRIKAIGPGTATLTGTLGGQQQTISVNVLAPVLPPVEENIEPFMATPASGHLYRMPVVIIRYFPTRDGVNLDSTVTGITSTLAALKGNVEQIERRHKFMLEEGSRFRAYGSTSVPPSLGYQVIKTITVYEDIPPGFSIGSEYFPDYNQILTRFGAENLVNNLGVKEFWLVHWHHGRIVPNESNMSSPTTGDISNSYRTNGDQPIYNKTYVTYGINFTRSQAEATHNHGHQLESILSHVNQLRDGNTTLWWQLFAKPVMAGANPPARCGNTHFPPNATQDYDYTNPNLVASDIMNWQPSGGPTTMVNANTWGNVPYQWPGGTAPPQQVESKWYIFWFQSMAGWGNTIPYNSSRLTNWWQFTGDWDAAIQAGIGLHEPAACSYSLSASSQAVPAAGGAGSVSVTCGAGCKWFASSNEPWINISGGRLGNGNGTINFSIAVNTGNARAGTIAIAGQVFTVNQASGCAILISPASQNVPATAGTGSITITAAAGCNWSATSNAPWITLANNSGSGNGSVGFMFAANTGPARTGTIDVNGQIFTLNQASGCSFTIDPTSQGIAASGGGGAVTVTASNSACPRTAASNDAWITITSGSSGTGSGTVNYSVAANSLPARSGTISIAGLMFTINQASGCPAISITPATLPPGTLAATYNQMLSASGGAGGHGFAVSAGSLPPGITLSTAGLISGAPNAAGVFNFTVTATDSVGCTGIITYQLVVAGIGLQYYPLPRPIRLFDTRAPIPGFPACAYLNQPLAADGEITRQARITCDGITIPANAQAIVGNATVTGAQGSGFITLYPNGQPRPPVSNLNYSTGQTVPNAFTVSLGSSGEFKVYSFAATHFIVDVTGYYAPPAPAGLYYHPLPRPIRLFDTRAPIPGFPACAYLDQPLVADAEIARQARITCDGITIPSDALAIVGNATVTGAQGAGFITLYPNGQTRPPVSNLNYLLGETVPNAFTVGLGNDGQFRVYSFAGTHFIVDVAGYYSVSATDANGPGLLYNPLQKPIRLFDTRAPIPGFPACEYLNQPLLADAEITRQARITCDGVTIPAAAAAIVGNATVTGATGSGFITLYPNGPTRPPVSNLNYSSGQTVPNAFAVGLGADGAFKVYAFAGTHFIVDVAGYFAP